MAENNDSFWTDFIFNPWRENKDDTRSRTSDANWKLPLKWDREVEKRGVRKRVFCASLADVFEDWNGPIVDVQGSFNPCCPGSCTTALRRWRTYGKRFRQTTRLALRLYR